MGYNYDNGLVYDWDGTYDDGPLSPVVPPNHTAPRRLPLPAGVPNASPTRAKHLAALAANDPLRMPSGAAEKRSAAARAHWAAVVVDVVPDAVRAQERELPATRVRPGQFRDFCAREAKVHCLFPATVTARFRVNLSALRYTGCNRGVARLAR